MTFSAELALSTAIGSRVLSCWLLSLAITLIPLETSAETLIEQGMRELEEYRMRQLQAEQGQATLEDFTTDGCSGNLSSSWEALSNLIPGFADQLGHKPPWEACCVAHDRSYWEGSVVDGFNRRLQADEALKACVVATGDRLAAQYSQRHSVTEESVHDTFERVSKLMYRAVRVGGQPCSLLPWRWGYGWPNCAFTAAAEAPAVASALKDDENIVFFNTAAWRDTDGAHWNIPIHAWVYEAADSVVRKGTFALLLEAEFDLVADNKSADYFDRRSNLLIADNERGKQLVVRIAGQDLLLPESGVNGQVYSVIKLPVDVVEANSEDGRLHYFAVTPEQDARRFVGEVQLVSGQGISIISDIDDTVKISAVTERRALLENTFFKAFTAVPGMADLYRELIAAGADLHFVSSSPWQLYTPLVEFLDAAGFPRATLDLKAFRFRDQTLLNLFKKGTETKPEQIKPLLQRFPDRKFILIGDSGEQDPEVYGEIARQFPDRIQRILIRNLSDDDSGTTRYREAFKGLSPDRWTLFKHPHQLSATKLLAPGR